jgi:D-alanyl-lipoteichoic acid acyltransferase DltB (MBOAT superfamily)
LAEAILDPLRLDGWFHGTLGGWNPAAIPIGVLLYLPVVPLFWRAGARSTVWLISGSSLALAWVTLGASFTILLGTAVLAGWAVTAAVRSAMARSPSDPAATTENGRRWSTPVVLGCALMLGLYGLLLACPQPAWLPKHTPQVYFYLQWAGLAYLTLKALQVLFELDRGNISTGRRVQQAAAEVARPPELTFGRYAAFLLFAPTLRMGPIFRYREFAAELEAAPQQRNRQAVVSGLGRIGLGLLRLGLVMAMTKEISAQELFDAPHELKTYQIVLGLYLQPLALFMWIAGYSDIAVGIGRLCGFRVPENFNFPWLASNIGEFWRRWHMTLSFWLRDYVYIPLGGNRQHVELNFVVTFVSIAIWHGLYPSYILWGLAQGVGLSVYRLWSRYWQRQSRTGSALYRRLQEIGFCGGRAGLVAAWLLTVNYELLTIALFMDEWHAGRRVIGELMARLTT